MKLIIWALYAVAPVALVLGNNGKSNVYKILSVPSSFIDGVTSESINTISKNVCALKTGSSLFSFKKETGACTYYDLRLPSNYQVMDDGNPRTSCYTHEGEGCFEDNLIIMEGESQVENNYEVTCINLVMIRRCIDTNQFVLEGETLIEDKYEVTCLNKLLIKRCVDGNLDVLEGQTQRVDNFEVTCFNKILIKKCIYANATHELIYQEGDTVYVNCYRLTCTQGNWTQAWVNAYPPVFITVTGVGSIAVVNYLMKSFEVAMQCCQDYGARLVIPDDYEALKQHMVTNYNQNYWYYVGIYNLIWMDGQSMDNSYWYRDEPSVGDVCGMIRPYDYYSGLLCGMPCDYEAMFICQKV